MARNILVILFFTHGTAIAQTTRGDGFTTDWARRNEILRDCIIEWRDTVKKDGASLQEAISILNNVGKQKLTVESKPMKISNYSYVQNNDLVIKGTSIDYTYSGKLWDMRTNSFFDDKRRITFVDGRQTELQQPGALGWHVAILHSRKLPDTFTNIHVFPAILSLTPGSPARSAFHPDVISPTGERQIIDRDACLEYSSDSKGKNLQVRLWLCPAKGNVVVRYCTYFESRLNMQMEITYINNNTIGLWVPKQWVTNKYSRTGAPADRIESSIVKLSIDTSAYTDGFRFTIPNGARVLDNTGPRPINTLIRNDGSIREIPDSDLRLDYNTLMTTLPGHGSLRRRSLADPYVLGTTLAGVALVAFSIFFGLRRYRRRVALPRQKPSQTQEINNADDK